MEFNWRSPVATRIALLVCTSIAFAFVFDGKNNSILLSIGLIAAIVFQASQLIKIAEHSHSSYPTPLTDITYNDTSSSFQTKSNNIHTLQLLHQMNEALNKQRQTKHQKDSEYQFFKNIVQHVGIGILTFKHDGAIQIINNAAKRLMRIDRADRLDQLRPVSEELVETFIKLKTGGRKLIRVKNGDETVQLSIYAIELTLRDEVVKLISMSNIQSELEEKEMEAWQNLVRVLTHEIMNSVTPISSLASTVEQELGSRLKLNELTLPREAAEDMHLSLQTISKRSEGLIKFVREFRNLTHIPQPQLSAVAVKPLLEELAKLHMKELSDNHISISISVEPMYSTLQVDKTLIEQVLINLIKNAIQSFDEKVERHILLTSYINEKGSVIISVKDNGTGIEPEALEKIFIPFFSTKKNRLWHRA